MTREAEKEYHERARAAAPLPVIDAQSFEREHFQPSLDGGGYYNDLLVLFRDRILRDGGWNGKRVLDYGCGLGNWSAYWALTGAKSVVGFDFCETGIQRGQERIRAQHLAHKVNLLVMDATHLGFPDCSFEMSLGVGVLHHVIKYPRIFEELYRVLEPGGKAYFAEGLADFPLFKLWWKIKGEVEEGDVPIFAGDVRMKASMFRDVEIVGDTFIFCLKRLLHNRSRLSKPRRFVLRTMRNMDEVLFRISPRLREWGCFSCIVLTK